MIIHQLKGIVENYQAKKLNLNQIKSISPKTCQDQ